MTLAKHLAQIVDADPASKRGLTAALEGDGFHVVTSDTCSGGVRDASLRPPDAIIVDMRVAYRHGIGFIKAIRRWSLAPILVVSSQGAEARRLAAFDAGADDYLLKPFSTPELLARVRAALRFHARCGRLPTAVLEWDGISIDLARRTVSHSLGHDLDLTRREYRVLETRARGGNRVVTRSQIMTAIWGPKSTNSVELRACVCSLRKKLENDPSCPTRILTEFGVGYRLIV